MRVCFGLGALGWVAFAIVAFGVTTQTGWVEAFNAWSTSVVQSARSPMLNGLVGAYCIPCNPLPCAVLLAALFAAFIGFVDRRKRSVALAAATILVGELIFQGAKMVFRNPRPSGQNIIDLPGSYSFPSGHTTASVLLFGLLALIVMLLLMRRGAPLWTRILVIMCAVLLSVAIGISRIYLGVHWGTDVIGGWSIGVAWCLPMFALLWDSVMDGHEQRPPQPSV